MSPAKKSTNRALPESWKTQDGRKLLIREMSDDRLTNALRMLKDRGFVSLREWQEARPDFPCGFQGEFAQMAAEQEYETAVEKWARTRFHPAIDAFQLEMSFRRRHNLKVAERPAGEVAFKEQVDPALPNDQASEPQGLFHQDCWRAERDPRGGDVVTQDRNGDWDGMPRVVGLADGLVTLESPLDGARQTWGLGSFKARFYLMAEGNSA